MVKLPLFHYLTVKNITDKITREGFFGEMIHGESAYIHDLMDYNFSKVTYGNMWRVKINANRNGNLYPPHSIGPSPNQ